MMTPSPWMKEIKWIHMCIVRSSVVCMYFCAPARLKTRGDLLESTASSTQFFFLFFALDIVLLINFSSHWNHIRRISQVHILLDGILPHLVFAWFQAAGSYIVTLSSSMLTVEWNWSDLLFLRHLELLAFFEVVTFWSTLSLNCCWKSYF